MTIKMQKFCDEYLVSGNATQSAIKAGYSEKTAYSAGQRLLKNVEVKSNIEERLKQVQDQQIADIGEVMRYLTKGMRQELDEEVIMLDANGEPVRVRKEIGIKDSNKCAEMLAKRFGILTDKVDVSCSLPVIISGADDLPE